MSRLFSRCARLTIARPIDGSFARGRDLTTIEDLRVAFSISKSLERSANTASVTVYNLSPETRAMVQTAPLQFRLEAGYDSEFRQIFFGDARQVRTRLDRVDWVTVCDLADGDRAMRWGRVSRSYRAGVSIATAVQELADSMGIDRPDVTGISDDLRVQFAAGLSLRGNAAREMTRVLAPLGLTWSVQDGRLQILGENDTRRNPPILISQDTGMIGSPERGLPESKRSPAKVTVSCLVMPEVTPGGKITINSLTENGTYKVLAVRHYGDTHGDDWYTEIEAQPI